MKEIDFPPYVDKHGLNFSNPVLIVVEQRLILVVIFDPPKLYEHLMVDFHYELNYVDNQYIDQSHQDDEQYYLIGYTNPKQMVEELEDNPVMNHMSNYVILGFDFLLYFEQLLYEDNSEGLEKDFVLLKLIVGHLNQMNYFKEKSLISFYSIHWISFHWNQIVLPNFLIHVEIHDQV